MGKSFLYYWEGAFIPSLISSDKIKARHFHSKEGFIDDLCSINDTREFGRSICEKYVTELELKVEHQSDHATILNLDITINDETFINSLFNKRDSSPFSIVRMPNIGSNIPLIFFIQRSF